MNRFNDGHFETTTCVLKNIPISEGCFPDAMLPILQMNLWPSVDGSCSCCFRGWSSCTEVHSKMIWSSDIFIQTRFDSMKMNSRHFHPTLRMLRIDHDEAASKKIAWDGCPAFRDSTGLHAKHRRRCFTLLKAKGGCLGV